MKPTTFLFSLLLILLGSCGTDTNETPTTDSVNTETNTPPNTKQAVQLPQTGTDIPDSLRVENIDTYALGIDRDRNLNFWNFGVTEEEGADKLSVGENKQGELLRVIYGSTSDERQYRHRYYKKDGQVVYYRFRTWERLGDNPYALEFYCYLKDGKIFKVLDRRKELKPEQRPQTMEGMPFNVPQINRDSMQVEVDKRFNEYLALIKANEKKRPSK